MFLACTNHSSFGKDKSLNIFVCTAQGNSASSVPLTFSHFLWIFAPQILVLWMLTRPDSTAIGSIPEKIGSKYFIVFKLRETVIEICVLIRQILRKPVSVTFKFSISCTLEYSLHNFLQFLNFFWGAARKGAQNSLTPASIVSRLSGLSLKTPSVSLKKITSIAGDFFLLLYQTQHEISFAL